MGKSTPGINKDKIRGTFTVHKQYKGNIIRKRGFETLNDAKTYLANEIYLIDHPIKDEIKDDVILDDVFKKYYAYRETNVRVATLEGDKYQYKNHIQPYFGSRVLSSITQDDVAAWRIEFVKKGFSDKYSNKVLSVFRLLLQHAFERNYKINTTVFLELKKIKTGKLLNERDILTYDEIDKFLSTFEKEVESEYNYWLYFYALSRSGMRPNEFRGLQVKDLKDDRISVNHDITNKVSGKGLIIQPCKNKSSNREVLMPNDIMGLLHEFTKGYNPNDFIFGKEKPYSETNIRRELDIHLSKANLKHITIYGFRHSHATHLIRNGVMIKVVSMRLGHKDIQTTLNTYQHLLKEDQESVLKVL